MKEERFPHTRKPFCGWRLRVAEGGSFGAMEEVQQQGCGGQSGEIPAQRMVPTNTHQPERLVCSPAGVGGGLGAEARASVGSQGENSGWQREHTPKGLAHHG